MHRGQRVLAIVPARAGSKGLPGKNLRALGGRPLVSWTLDAARAASSIDDIAVSTDDPAVATIARRAGIRVPALRPRALATDLARSIDVVAHEVEAAVERGRTPDLVLLLQPTSPLRTAADIEGALDLRADRGAAAVISVAPADVHPWHTNVLPADLSLAGFIREEARHARRQDLPPSFHLNGAIYLGERAYLSRHDGFLGPETIAYVMPRERSVDIDDLTDLLFAETLLAARDLHPSECRR